MVFLAMKLRNTPIKLLVKEFAPVCNLPFINQEYDEYNKDNEFNFAYKNFANSSRNWRDHLSYLQWSPRSHVNSLSTFVEVYYSKHDRLLVGAESKALTLLFQTPAILPSLLPSSPEEFTIDVADEDISFVWSLFITYMRGLFAKASRTLFRAGSRVLMVAARQNDVLSYGDLSKEHNGIKEKCEAFKRENFEVEKELNELRIKAEFADSL
ncbi:unnamed protein product [Vicia faba]|uniref:Uncharacterized protein n=1 Tax=Vicia faba TaxID=3906 RepID=A0AAV0ZST9_VICFA|nr:unnamed protein product [Vicia faba]